ncbi:hypothetical protein BCR36DRAFT_587305 [Piromyces finnis]|uniref:Uncharacterized protein n=1 Tax=Piromyces finnis TaxID=1754191 RepID=A0A1Y1UXA6_9FUNG|nr:hypothetical protein BCR36DRAFT_587305 [Piromyces finnis]|eukprot:ORX42312.1 hypothetical protein BCR36DRAFT_587305 [Piromyces finnis]
MENKILEYLNKRKKCNDQKKCNGRKKIKLSNSLSNINVVENLEKNNNSLEPNNITEGNLEEMDKSQSSPSFLTLDMQNNTNNTQPFKGFSSCNDNTNKEMEGNNINYEEGYSLIDFNTLNNPRIPCQPNNDGNNYGQGIDSNSQLDLVLSQENELLNNNMIIHTIEHQQQLQPQPQLLQLLLLLQSQPQLQQLLLLLQSQPQLQQLLLQSQSQIPQLLLLLQSQSQLLQLLQLLLQSQPQPQQLQSILQDERTLSNRNQTKFSPFNGVNKC